MIKILNTKEFVEALRLSHKAGDKAFEQFTNFLERFSQDNSDLTFYSVIGGSKEFLGWNHKNINGGLLFDQNRMNWSSHT
jgi:hypothetical protein